MLEIKSHTDAYLPLTICACRNEEIILSGRACNRQIVEINESRAIIEYCGIQDIVELHHGPKPSALAQLELSRNVQVKSIKNRAVAGVSRKVTADRTDRRKR